MRPDTDYVIILHKNVKANTGIHLDKTQNKETILCFNSKKLFI